MDKFQNKYRIPSARANWHDYNGGIYFITICTKNREHYLGEIIHCEIATRLRRDAINRVSTETEPQMVLSEIGQITTQNLQNVTSHYPYAEIPLFVVMPDHIHAIVLIDGENVDGCNDCNRRDAINRVSTMPPLNEGQRGGITGDNNPMLRKCLGTVIRGLKARITRAANEKNIIFAWQTRFHDHIIRNQDELNRIAEYIENNVANWQSDKSDQTT